jgi:hypothetical protein
MHAEVAIEINDAAALHRNSGANFIVLSVSKWHHYVEPVNASAQNYYHQFLAVGCTVAESPSLASWQGISGPGGGH